MNFLIKVIGRSLIKCLQWITGAILCLCPSLVEQMVKSELKAAGVHIVQEKAEKSDLIRVKGQEENQCKTQETNGNQNENGRIEMRIKDGRVYKSIGSMSEVKFLNGFVNGLWDCDQLDDLLVTLLKLKMNPKNPLVSFFAWLDYVQFEILDDQGVEQNSQGCRQLYDFGNAHFGAIFGPSMKYSCALWEDAQDLDTAQLASMELIGRKLKLKEGMKVLYIGAGWGHLAKFLADKYKVQVTAVSNSIEGVTYAKDLCQNSNVQVKLADYRELHGQFDRILSIEMIEHIGPKNYSSFFEVVDRCLTPDGLVFIQLSVVGREGAPRFSTWVHSAFCANSYIPHTSQILKSLESLFIVEDVQNLGLDYKKTAEIWIKNLEKNWPQISHLYKDEDKQNVYRTWRLFFTLAVASFKSREMALWHLILSKKNQCLALKNTYRSVR